MKNHFLPPLKPNPEMEIHATKQRSSDFMWSEMKINDEILSCINLQLSHKRGEWACQET